ncbi:MAG TPA: tRNA-dihydrouridine synthase, partial [Flavisolibacter sp.]|nr:tRNA-dihydrouridine synthase [Flavisolibacter sp.]
TGTHLPPPTIQQRVEVIQKHLHRSVEWKGIKAGINEMRRHYTNYLRGLPNIKEFRLKLVTINEPEEIDAVLEEVIRTYDGYEFPARRVDMDAMAYSCG